MHLGIEFHIGQNFLLNLWPGLLEFDLFSSIRKSHQGKNFFYFCHFLTCICARFTLYQNFWWGSKFRSWAKSDITATLLGLSIYLTPLHSIQLLHLDEHLSLGHLISPRPFCEDWLILVGSKRVGLRDCVVKSKKKQSHPWALVDLVKYLGECLLLLKMKPSRGNELIGELPKLRWAMESLKVLIQGRKSEKNVCLRSACTLCFGREE